MSPAIPFTFGPYRMWQLARGLWALGMGQAAVAGAPGWAASLLVFELAFWVFDHGVTALQLPWVFNWQRQPGVGGAGKQGAAAAVPADALASKKEE